MKTVFALVAFFLSSAASAACYQIFSPSNALVWQNNQPPVAMDNPTLDDEVKRLVPGGHMIVVDSRAACPVLDLTGKNRSQHGDDWARQNLGADRTFPR